MQGLVQNIHEKREKYALCPGDALIANDPFLGGGSHLPDITLVKPVYHKKKLIGYVASIAHWSDVGGRSPGVGTAGDSTEIFQEGLRIPPVKILRNDRILDDIQNFLLSNMRNRKERLGDFRAQLASIFLGERRLLELCQRYDLSVLKEAVTEIQDYSERWLRKRIKEIPQGIYTFEDYMDDDGISEKHYKIKVDVRIRHRPKPAITFDFAESSSQAEGGINMVWPALLASVYYSVKAVVAPDVPLNGGFQKPIRINAKKGSLVNAQEPAAVGGRTDTCQRVVDTILGAFAVPLPERVMAASNGATTAIIFGGTKALSGEDFVYVEALGGGMGGRPDKDGMNGVQVHITNTSNLPVEAMEMEYPFRVLKYELVPGSGGAGKFRGGMSIRKVFQTLVPVIFSAHSDRHKIAPWGLRGGLPGIKGKFYIRTGEKKEKILPSKISMVMMKSGDILSVRTAGGGGYGPPEQRSPEKIRQDIIEGRITRGQARKKYNFLFRENKKASIDSEEI
jgi:N-methylhydantoinase B